MQSSDALDAAKKLHGVIIKLAERRERRVQKATGAFQIDLLHTIRDVPTPILDIVEQAVRLDPGQAYLQLALAVAIDERRRARAAEAETESPPAPVTLDVTGGEFAVEGDPGVLDDLESPMESDDAPPRPRVETYTNGVLLVPEYAEQRYPEPGEPATLLPDGTVIAIDPALPDGSIVEVDPSTRSVSVISP